VVFVGVEGASPILSPPNPLKKEKLIPTDFEKWGLSCCDAISV